jgi:DNA repair exonuclease SbcCD nuclease subunit
MVSFTDMQRGNQMSSRKRFFQDLENEGTSAASKNLAHEANYKISKKTMFFEHLEDEATSVNPRMRNDQMNSNLIENEGTSTFENTSNDNENTTGIPHLSNV